MSTKGANTGVDSHQIMAAGLAATGAAFVTSRFGVAGTLLGAALTAMIITGGSAVLKAYIENTAGRVRSGATRLQERREVRATAAPEAEAPTAQKNPANPPGRPDLRDNFAGRMRAAVDWFRQLPTPARRPILIKALLAAVVALVICLVAIWGVEKLIGNSLSCGIWSRCPYGADPGVHVAGFDDSGAGSTLSGGGVDLGGGGVDLGGGGGGVIDSIRQGGGVPDGRDLIPGGGGGGGGGDSSASPAPRGGEEAPSSASPEAEPIPEEDPSSASPAVEKQAAPEASASASPEAQ